MSLTMRSAMTRTRHCLVSWTMMTAMWQTKMQLMLTAMTRICQKLTMRMTQTSRKSSRQIVVPKMCQAHARRQTVDMHLCLMLGSQRAVRVGHALCFPFGKLVPIAIMKLVLMHTRNLS